MLAMQYRFTLPADYDMAIVRRRIANFGHLLDNYPQLIVKAYLYAEAGSHSAENRYAPFYLWNSSIGMCDFLASPGFATLTRDFGWPQVSHWLPWEMRIDRSALAEARFATQECRPIAPYSDLAALRRQHRLDDQAVGGVIAFDPAGWQWLRLQLWRELPAHAAPGSQCYAIGHISAPFDQSQPSIDNLARY